MKFTPTPIKHKALLRSRQRRPVLDMVVGVSPTPIKHKALLRSRPTPPKFGGEGFTIIEILVCVAIFSLLILAMSSITFSTIKAQRKSLAYQELLDQTSYAMEYMSKILRMAKKDENGTCITAGYNYGTTSLRSLADTTYSGPGIKFIDYHGNCQEFFLDTGDYLLKQINWSASPSPSLLPLISSKLEVNPFQVNLSGESQGDYLQPRVTISLDIKGQSDVQIKIQTTISQRDIDE